MYTELFETIYPINTKKERGVVVSGVDPRLAWQEETSVRYLAQSLLEKGAAYSVAGKYLILASSKEFARDITRSNGVSSTPDLTSADGPVQFFAVVRVADAKPVFDKLMSKLDGKEDQPASEKKDDTEEGEKEIKFFSENLSSLISAVSFREMRFHREMSATTMVERVVYSW